jgi:hypothetical protein
VNTIQLGIYDPTDNFTKAATLQLDVWLVRDWSQPLDHIDGPDSLSGTFNHSVILPNARLFLYWSDSQRHRQH